MGSCFQLVFAPIDELFPDDAPLIASGFRVIPLGIKSVEYFLLTSFVRVKFRVLICVQSLPHQHEYCIFKSVLLHLS
jgi:hypothetical protein